MQEKVKGLLQRTDWRMIGRDYAWLTVGTIILAVSFNTFIVPANVAPGGVSAIALIVNYFLALPNGLVMFVVSMPLLVLGYYQLGRFRFLTRTLYATAVYNSCVDLIAFRFGDIALTDDLLLNTLYGGIVGGLGYGLVLRGRGLTAGTGILSRYIQRRTGIPVSQVYIFVDGGIVFALGAVFGWDRALYAALMIFIWGVATDYVLEGPSVIRMVFIVTNLPQPVAEAILSRLRIGVTSWQGQGRFYEAERTVLFCTITRPDVETVKDIVIEIDPQAFVVVGQGHRAVGGMSIPITHD